VIELAGLILGKTTAGAAKSGQRVAIENESA
jgi:hypothetical protein